jgi:uncharacterized protein YlaI
MITKKPKRTKKAREKRLIRVKQRKLLKLWSMRVRERDKVCFVCGTDKNLDAHHLCSKEMKDSPLRFDLINGITLCKLHHKFSYHNSPHKQPLIFIEMFRFKFPERVKYLCEHCCDKVEYSLNSLSKIEESLST